MTTEYEVPPLFPPPPAELPPPQDGSKANPDNTAAMANIRREFPTLRNRIPSGNISNMGQELKGEMRVIPDDFKEDVSDISVSTDTALPLAVTLNEGGLNEQETAMLLGWQPKFTVPVYPFTGDTVTLKFAEPPAFTVAVLGDMEPLKSQTCSVAELLCIAGLLVPVIVKL